MDTHSWFKMQRIRAFKVFSPKWGHLHELPLSKGSSWERVRKILTASGGGLLQQKIFPGHDRTTV